MHGEVRIHKDGKMALSAAICLVVSGFLTAPLAAQSLRPAPLAIPPAEMLVMVEGEGEQHFCVPGQFSARGQGESDRPHTYPVHLGAGADFIVLDTARAGSPAFACDTAMAEAESGEGEVVQTRWMGVIYGPELSACTVSGSPAGRAYGGPCRYGWVRAETFEPDESSRDAVLAVNDELND